MTFPNQTPRSNTPNQTPNKTRDHLRRSQQGAASGNAAQRGCLGDLGLRSYPSLGNFVLVDTGRDASDAYRRLLRAGLIVRPMGPWGLPDHVRISVGTPEQLERMTGILSDVLGG
ncbi:MAG: aminotransferase class I/II-fold pyridoxal phosphate-dependent enzyme [Myxococcota bacterium]